MLLKRLGFRLEERGRRGNNILYGLQLKTVL
jgi:hypothetical protein